MGFCSVVFIVLLVLKLLGLASITWAWVFTPLLIELLIIILMVIFAAVMIIFRNENEESD